MDIMLLHDSHNEFYRTPSGPAPAGSNVLIRLHCDEATSVVLRTWMTEELCYTMLPTAEHVWEVAIPLPTTPGLFWYYFLIYRKDGRTIRYGNQPDKLGGVGVAYDHGEPESFRLRSTTRLTRRRMPSTGRISTRFSPTVSAMRQQKPLMTAKTAMSTKTGTKSCWAWATCAAASIRNWTSTAAR